MWSDENSSTIRRFRKHDFEKKFTLVSQRYAVAFRQPYFALIALFLKSEFNAVFLLEVTSENLILKNIHSCSCRRSL